MKSNRSSYPKNCNECPFYECCGSAMYMEGCSFYRPEEKTSFLKYFKKIFNLKF